MDADRAGFRQAFYIRALNGLGRALQSSGVAAPELDADALCARARRRTGLSDWGGDDIAAPLHRLVDALREEAGLSQVGRIAAYLNLLDHLSVRLRLVDYRARRPEVARQRIERPLFIVGLPRTGTTILYELIAQDPAFRAPLSWEVARPLPPPGVDAAADPRIRGTDRLLGLLEKLAPGFRRIHPVGARLPQECVYLMASSFLSEQYAYMYNVPGYRDWLLRQDMAPAYRWHAAFLQHLQVDSPRGHWVLKTPAHLAHLDALLHCYPDAAVVWTHRRPLQALASFSSLTTTLRGAFSDGVDPLRVGPGEWDYHAAVVGRGMAARQKFDQAQFLDVAFADICADPVAVVREIYSHFSLTLGAAAERRMRAYLAGHPRNRFGVHRYTARSFGLEAAAEQAQFGAYLERFDPWLAAGQAHGATDVQKPSRNLTSD